MATEKKEQVKAVKKEKADKPISEDAAKLEALTLDMTEGESPAVLREISRLQLENKNLKSRLLRVWFSVAFLSATLLVIVWAVLDWYPKYRYIATTNNDAICEITADSEPRVSDASLGEFAREAIVNSFSYDYINYRETLNNAMNKWFTTPGKRAFQKSLAETGNIKTVLAARLIQRTMATHTPSVAEEGVRGFNEKYWVVKLPIAIEFFTGGNTQPQSRQNFLASVVIVQVTASALNMKGIAIDTITLSPFIGQQ
jgi:intracellular multiplication protein IcmL